MASNTKETSEGLILYDAPWIFRLPKRSLENFYGGLSDDQETSLQRVSGEDYKSSGTSFQVDKLDPENYMKDLTDEELLLVSVHVPTCSSTSKKRTSKLEYNRVLPGERYFMYSPSGGFNNQRKELEYGLKISKLLNRTLLVPMAAKHTSRWMNYHALNYDDMIPMDIVLDFKTLSQFGTRIIPLNLTIKDLEAQLLQRDILEIRQQKYRMQWKGEEEIKAKLYSDSVVLFLKGPTMYHPWFEYEEMRTVRQHVVFAKAFRRIALEIIKAIGTTEYNAIHIRMGDYANRGRMPNPNSFIADLHRKGLVKKSPLYIATEPGRLAPFFGKFDRTFKTFYANNFNHIHKRYRVFFPAGTRADFIGIVEQMVCVGARKFVGTRYSTFSEWIYEMRKTKQAHFPELKEFRSLMMKQNQLPQKF